MGKALRKQQLRLVRRQLAYSAVAKYGGFHRPGSMNPRKSYPIGKGR